MVLQEPDPLSGVPEFLRLTAKPIADLILAGANPETAPRQELLALGRDVLRMQGVSSPFPWAALSGGESVLDLGSGFGIDVFLASMKVGERGRCA